MTNTNKHGYSVAEVCQILGCSHATVYKLIDSKEIECNIADPKTPGGRRQFRFEKDVQDTPTRPKNPNMDRITPDEWAGKTQHPTAKPYLRTPEVKAEEQRQKAEANRTTPTGSIVKKFPGFKVTLNGTDMVSGLEPSTAGKIVEALMSDRNLRVTELTISFDGAIEKEVPNREK